MENTQSPEAMPPPYPGPDAAPEPGTAVPEERDELKDYFDSHPEVAHFVADLMQGAQLGESIKAHFAEELSEVTGGAADAVEMYQSAAIEAARKRREEEIAGGTAPEPFPSFLENIRPGFWD